MGFMGRVLITCLILGPTAFAAPPPIQSLRITTPEPISTALLNLTATFDKTNLTASKYVHHAIEARAENLHTQPFR